MKQRVAIARGMAMEPAILLMDEPFAALDALTRGKMQEELLQLWDDTKFTVLFVTHSIPEAVRIGNRILLLSAHPGQVKGELNSVGADTPQADGSTLSGRIEQLLFERPVTDESQPMSDARDSPALSGPKSSAACRPRGYGVVQKPLSTWEKLADYRRLAKDADPARFWRWSGKLYARWLGNPLVFPDIRRDRARILERDRHRRDSCGHLVHSMKVLFQGYLIGLLLAGVFTAFASATRIGSDLLETLTSMFNPLPSIALLPLAMIWFGLGNAGIIFVLIHAVLWSVALNTHAGFRGVSPTWRMVGQNYGLSRIGYVTRILIPGAFPSILTGLKIGWAFAWRTLIAAELVFGANAGDGGLGWYIFENKNALEIPTVFAGLLTVILLGIMVENVVFLTIEKRTVRRWGMQT